MLFDHTPLVTDHRPLARGLLMKGLRTWGAIAAAVLIVVIIVVSKDPPAAPPADVPMTAGVTTTPERARRVQTRLAETLLSPPAQQGPTGVALPRPYVDDQPRDVTPRQTEGTMTDRERRDYESLFTSPVVWSKRPGAADLLTAPRQTAPPAGDREEDSLERITREAMRQMGIASQDAVAVKQDAGVVPKQDSTPPAQSSRAVAPGTHRVYEGTVIDAALTNRLAGSMEGPVNGLVTNPVYAQDLTLVIPAGARVLGSAKSVQNFGDERLAVAFHRVVLPDGRDISLDKFIGMNQLADVGLKDKVNNHYLSTFGASAAVGLISGFSQFVGSGFTRDRGNTVVIGGAIDSTAQATAMTMNRFLNRLPTITIREGHRMKVYLTSDLDLQAWRHP